MHGCQAEPGVGVGQTHAWTDGSAQNGLLISQRRLCRGGKCEVQFHPEEGAAGWCSVGVYWATARRLCKAPGCQVGLWSRVGVPFGKRTLAPKDGGQTEPRLDVQPAGELQAGRLPGLPGKNRSQLHR